VQGSQAWCLSVLVWALALPVPAQAQVSTQTGPAGAAAVDPQAEGQRLFDEASAAYNLGKFADAIAKFEAAYELLKAPSLLYNLGQAHAKAYELDQELAHLRQAKLLFTNFIKIREGVGESTGDAKERVEALEAEIAAKERVAAEPARPVEMKPVDAAPEPAPRRRRPPGPLTYAGAGLLAGGLLAGAGLAVTGFVSRARLGEQAAAEGSLVRLPELRAEEYAEQQSRASAMAYAGIGVGAALVVTGAVLMIVDRGRRGRPAASASARVRLFGAGMAVNF
jgi:tetratricopeptide (TPR) repeat protein